MESEDHHHQAWLKQGVEHHQRGEFDQARSCYERIPPYSGSFPKAQCNLAILAMHQQQPERAVQLLRQAINQHPDFVEAHCNLGAILESLGRPDEAEAPLRRALTLQPNHASALFNLGNTLSRQQRPEAAEPLYRSLLELNPEHQGALFNLGNALVALKRLPEARSCFTRLLERNPDHAPAQNNLGEVLKELGDLSGAEACFRQAHALDPEDGASLNNWAGVVQMQGRLDESESLLLKLLAQHPNQPHAHYNLGTLRLLTGRWVQGWPGYEYRGYTQNTPPQRPLSLPRWRGEPPHGGDALLVLPEQGFGDALQLVRYLPLLARRFARVSLVCPPALLRLFRQSLPVELLEQRPLDPTPWRWQVPLLSLPMIFGTTPETVPAGIPYLRVDPEEVRHWKARLDAAAPTGLPRIGLVWAGSRKLEDDARRSIPLNRFAPLLALPGMVWVSLQKGEEGDKEHRPDTGHWLDWMGEVGDFAATAALIAALDRVIAVDTAVAHLAGALGKPVWLLNRFESEWRWMWKQTRSPWYPTLRIFNQPAPRDWETPIGEIALALGRDQDPPESSMGGENHSTRIIQ